MSSPSNSQPTQTKSTQPLQINPHQSSSGGEGGGSGDGGGGKGGDGFINLANMGLICFGVTIAPKGEDIGVICSSTEFGKPFSLSNVNFFMFGFQSASFMPPFIQEMASKMMDMHAGTPQGQLVDQIQLPESAGASAPTAASGSGTGGSSSDAPPVSFSTPRSTASNAMSAGTDRGFNKFPSIPTLQVKSAGRVSKMELGGLAPDHTPHVSSGKGTTRGV